MHLKERVYRNWTNITEHLENDEWYFEENAWHENIVQIINLGEDWS